MRIALISDTHLAQRAEEFAENFSIAAAFIDRSAFDFVIHLGDITADGAGNPAEFGEAKTLLAALDTKILYLPGNHDIGDNPAGPGARSAEHPFDPGRLDAYRMAFGPDRWTLSAEDWSLIGLNAQLFNTGTELEEEQFAWLETNLGSVTGPIALFLHKPLFRDGPEDAEVHVRYVPAAPRRRLLDILAGKDLRLVLSGHAHQIRRISVDGVEHIWLPSTAFTIPDRMQERVGEKNVGFATLELSGGGFRYAIAKPEMMRNLDLLDHPHVYPQLTRDRQAT